MFLYAFATMTIRKRCLDANKDNKKEEKRKKYCCTHLDCDYATNKKSHLTTHMRTHTGERPYVCQEDGCTAAFASSSQLTNHTRTHTGERPYVCQEGGCTAAFTRSSHLTIHMRTHTGERPYVCQEGGCTAAFTRSSNLTEHMRTHTGERPYVCQEDGCIAAFATSGHLTDHMRTHTGERPYVCQEGGCTAAFTRSSHLTNHMRTHTGETPFVCPIEWCNEAFSWRSTFKHHMRSWHTQRGQLRQKKQEERIADALSAAEIQFDREQRINYSCVHSYDKKYAKIDFVIYTDYAYFLLEVDEHQHNTRAQVNDETNRFYPWSYTVACDMARMGHVNAALIAHWSAKHEKQLPIVWLRYNPDSCYVNGKLNRVTKKDREAKLVDLLKTFKPKKPLTIMYLYYDCQSSEVDAKKMIPDVITHTDFDKNLAKSVVDPIV